MTDAPTDESSGVVHSADSTSGHCALPGGFADKLAAAMLSSVAEHSAHYSVPPPGEWLPWGSSPGSHRRRRCNRRRRC